MIKCQDLIEKIEERYPRIYACDWDNVGLLAGDRELRGWLLEERRHPLYRGRSFTCKTAVFLCLYGYPLFHLVKLAIRWLRKAVRRLERR